MGMTLEAKVPEQLPLTWSLKAGETAVIGRAAEASLRVESDRQLSRRHAEVLLEGDAVKVKLVGGATNPIYFQGRPQEQFLVKPGEFFLIGQTKFSLFQTKDQAAASPSPETRAPTDLRIWESRLEGFFSRPVVSWILKSPDLACLSPKLAVATVLSFGIHAEDTNAEILGGIDTLKAGLSAITQIILEEQGVLLQYTGDGILACWNLPFDMPDHAVRAAHAALRMASAFAAATGGWRCGIGLHTGEVVAGVIGSEQVFSYGVLGKIVNQASRVEGITKIVGAPILATRELAEKLSPKTACAVRLGRFKPAGMATPIELFELTPAPGDPKRAAGLAAAVEAVEKGDWSAAVRGLSALDSADKPASYFRSLAQDFAKNPPSSWTGTIELSAK